MRPSISATLKWARFFPHHDLVTEYHWADAPTDAEDAQIRRQCPRWGAKTEEERGAVWRVSPARAVFVVAQGEFVIDVFPLEVSA